MTPPTDERVLRMLSGTRRPPGELVPHPIQNRTREELARIADEAIAPLLRLLQPGADGASGTA